MEFSKKRGKNSLAKHLRNKKGKWTKRMANSKSRQEMSSEVRKGESTPFEILKSSLEEAIKLKASGNYHDRDFDSMVDAL